MAFRALRAHPGTTLITVFTIAIAAGVNLAMTDIARRALVGTPSGVVSPERVFMITFESVTTSGERFFGPVTSQRMFETIRDSGPAFKDLSAWFQRPTAVSVSGEDVQARVLLVSGSYFGMLRSHPLVGRTLDPGDDVAPAGSNVAVISDAFWRSRFAADRTVLGRRLQVDGTDFTIVGIMPAGFSGHSTERVDLWIPLQAGMRDMPRWDLLTTIVLGVRIPRDVNVASVATQASQASRHQVVLMPLGEFNPFDNPALYWLAAASALLLVIGLANAAMLQAVQRARRRREFAIRAALGASRARLTRDILVESCSVSVLAAAAALLLSSWMSELLRRILFPTLVESAGWDLRLVEGALAAGILTMIVTASTGVAQLRSLARLDLAGVASHPWRRTTAQSELILVQTTLAVVLVVGAGVFARSYHLLATQDFGMHLDGLFTVEFSDRTFRPGWDERLLDVADVLRKVPSFEAVTPVQALPFRQVAGLPLSTAGWNTTPTLNGMEPQMYGATAELFSMLGLRVISGRALSAADQSGPPVVVVSETMARTIWPGENALGKCVRVGEDPSYDPRTAVSPSTPPATAPCRVVVGVVRDVGPSGNDLSEWRVPQWMQYYVPLFQTPEPPRFMGPGPRIQALLIASKAEPEQVVAAVRRAVGGTPDRPLMHVRRYADVVRPPDRGVPGAALFGLFGTLALAIAAGGLYATFAHAVVERRREMAIRLAVGASHAAVIRMVLLEGASLAARGVICGCAVAAFTGRWIQSMVFGTSATDPLALGSAAAVMLTVALTATFIPAMAAAQADVARLLRRE